MTTFRDLRAQGYRKATILQFNNTSVVVWIKKEQDGNSSIILVDSNAPNSSEPFVARGR